MSSVIRYLIQGLGKVKDFILQFLQSCITLLSFWDWKSESLWIYFIDCAFNFIFRFFKFKQVVWRWRRKSTCVSWVSRFLRLLYIFRRSVGFFFRFTTSIMWRRIVLFKFNDRMNLLHLLQWTCLSCCQGTFIYNLFSIPLRKLKLLILHWREFLNNNTR